MNRQATNNNNGQPQPPQMPPIQNVPIWDREADIIVKGYEWEVIFNSVANLQVLAQATNSVMSRNVISGVVGMDFKKLDPVALDYVDMTPEEKAPYLEDFKRVVEQLRNPQPQPTEEVIASPDVEPQPEQEGKLVSMYKEDDETVPVDSTTAPDFAIE